MRPRSCRYLARGEDTPLGVACGERIAHDPHGVGNGRVFIERDEFFEGALCGCSTTLAKSTCTHSRGGFTVDEFNSSAQQGRMGSEAGIDAARSATVDIDGHGGAFGSANDRRYFRREPLRAARGCFEQSISAAIESDSGCGPAVQGGCERNESGSKPPPPEEYSDIAQ